MALDVLAKLSPEELEHAPAAPAPRTAGAMKAVLTDDHFSDPNWIYERKLDGIRCIAIRDGAQLHLLSRNDLSGNARSPDRVGALAPEQTQRSAIDGEVVAFDGSETSFTRLVERRQHWVPVF